MSEKITIQEILRGTTIGRMQSVGVMSVIPLISEMHDDRFEAPSMLDISTTNYGTLKFNNPADKDIIVPCHAGYVVKQAAQDHAMSKTGYVKAGSTKTYNTAMCIQESQGGYISDAQHEMLVLPFSLREKALKVKDQQSYGKLWEAISEFNSELGVRSSGGHLEYFLNGFKKELDEFVAQFEIVENQIGAIVLINGYVVGIERTPSAKYFFDIWKSLIRECYGSLAIKTTKDEGVVDIDKIKSPLRTNVSSLSDIEQALKDARKDDEEMARAKVRRLLQDDFSRSKEETVNSLDIEHVEHDQFTGQLIREDLKVIYASLVSKEKFMKNSEWLESEPFTC